MSTSRDIRRTVSRNQVIPAACAIVGGPDGGLGVFELDDDIKGSGRSDAGRSDAPRYGQPVEIGRLLRSLMRKRWLILAGAFVGMATGVVVAKTIVPRVYIAETVMVWETDEGRATPNVRELRTLVDSVKLPTNLALIRSTLAIEATLEGLGARLDVHFDRDSNLVIVRAEADSGAGAVELSETAVQIFLDHQSGIAGERLQEDVEASQGDVERARESLGRAQASYDAFRRESGVSDLSLEREQAIELTASLRAQAEIARADGQAAEARRSVRPTSTRGGESTHLRELRRRLQLARSRLSEDHPRVQSLAAEVAAVAATEVNTGGSRASSASTLAARDRAAAQRRQETYERLQADARARLTELSAVEGEASALLASVRVAEGHVADVEADLARAQDEARGASPGFRVVAQPIEPEEPTRSYRKPTAIGLPIVFFLVLLLLLLAYELKGLRVKTANELAYWGQAPVVGSTTWPNSSRELSAIIHELAESADRAGGQTLVVSASDLDLDQDIAKDVAEHLTVSAASGQERSNRGQPEAISKTYYDPNSDVITAPPSEKRAIGAGSSSSSTAIVVAPSDTIIVDPDLESEVNPAVMPQRARREERTIARRRGRHLEQVRVTKSEVYLDDDEVHAPTEFLTQEGPKGDAYVRRSARSADRVLVIVRSGDLSITRASELRALVGREDAGVGFLLIAVPSWLSVLADRAGPVADFWRATQED